MQNLSVHVPSGTICISNSHYTKHCIINELLNLLMHSQAYYFILMNTVELVFVVVCEFVKEGDCCSSPVPRHKAVVLKKLIDKDFFFFDKCVESPHITM